MQRRREIECGSDPALVAHKRRVEAGLHGIGLNSLSNLGEANRLIAQGRQNFLMPQQALAFRFKYQHRFAGATTGHARQMSSVRRFIGRDAWKPDIETRSNPGGALDRDGPVVFLNDFTNRREPETVAVGTCRKERLENPLQRRFVHTAPGIRDRYDRKATGTDVDTTDAQHLCYFPHFDSNLDDTRPVHCLCSIVADVEDDLLQLCRFRRYDSRFGRFVQADPNMGR